MVPAAERYTGPVRYPLVQVVPFTVSSYEGKEL